MKRYITADVTDINLIISAIDFAAKDKTDRHDVAEVLSNKLHYATMLQEMINNRNYVPSPVHKMVIIDGASKKKRTIYCPKFFPDQCFHHVMMQAAVPIIMKGMSPHCFASVPKRGAHYGKKFMKRWMESDRKNTKYCIKLDIRKFYPSIPHDLLMRKIRRKFKDKTLLWMFETLINTHEDSPNRGLAIGFYPSQWLSNFYLQDFDHYVKEVLHIKYYCRYMDDIVIFGCNKKTLQYQLQQIRTFIEDQGLCIKNNWQLFRCDYVVNNIGKTITNKKDIIQCLANKSARRHGRDLDFMGFRFYRDKITIRRRNSLKIRQFANHLHKNLQKGKCISVHRAAGLLSGLGWIKHTNGYRFRIRYIDNVINIGLLKSIVSHNSKLLYANINRKIN